MVYAENTVTGIFGHKGSGKTTTGVTLTLIEKIINDINRFYSNIRIEYEGFNFLHGRDMVELKKHLDGSLIFIDELHEYADSRNSQSFQNKRVSDFFLQSRHTQSDIFYTTQFKDQIDKRIRRITDVNIVTENLFIDSDNDGYDDLFNMTITDIRRPDCKPLALSYYAKPVFDLFDSTERVNPFIFNKKEEIKLLKEEVNLETHQAD